MRTVVSLFVIASIAAVVAINIAHNYTTRVNAPMAEVNNAIEDAKRHIHN